MFVRSGMGARADLNKVKSWVMSWVANFDKNFRCWKPWGLVGWRINEDLNKLHDAGVRSAKAYGTVGMGCGIKVLTVGITSRELERYKTPGDNSHGCEKGVKKRRTCRDVWGAAIGEKMRIYNLRGKWCAGDSQKWPTTCMVWDFGTKPHSFPRWGVVCGELKIIFDEFHGAGELKRT